MSDSLENRDNANGLPTVGYGIMDKTVNTAREVIRGLVAGDRVRSSSMIFFHILVALPVKFDDTVIAATDGSYLYVGSKFLRYSKQDEEFILFHEVMHIIYQHPLRGIGKIHEIWGQAADYMVNGTLDVAGMQVPKDALFNPMYDTKSITTNDIYNELLNNEGYKEEENNKSKEFPYPSGKGKNGRGGGEGENISNEKKGQGKPMLVDDLKPYDPIRADTVQKAVREAAQIAGSIANSNTSSHDSQIASELLNVIRQHAYNNSPDWKAILAEYVSRYTQSRKYTFALPSKKYISSDIYMPRRVREREATVAVVVDTSGSVDDVMLNSFMVEVENIFQTENLYGYLILFSGGVYKTLEIPPFPLADEILTGVSRGSTNFASVLDWVEVNASDIDVMIALTDMEIEEYLRPPPYPVIWVTKTPNRNIKYGDIIEIN